MSKPFNPILGETFQCKIKDSLYYCEQTSHHPPILNYFIKNPLFTAFGNQLMVATTAANSINAQFKGKYFIRFNDGATLTWSLPDFWLGGAVMGKRLINYKGDIVVQDLVRLRIINIDE